MAMKRSSSSTVVLQESAPTQPHVSPPPLKLRIKHQTLTQRLTVDLYDAKSNKEKLITLMKFSTQLKYSLIPVEEFEQIIRFLKDLIKKENDLLIKCKSVEIMGEICQRPRANKHQIVEDILDSLHKETNHNFVACVFRTLSNTVTLLLSKTDFNQKILKTTIKRVDDTHYDVRCACLNLIGRICSNEPIKISSGRSMDSSELFSEFSSDQDPRVRAEVYQSLLTLHQRGHSLDVSVYDKACSALNDDYENVRLAAVKLIWVFSHIFPERLVKTAYDPNETIRLLDDAFIKICNMVNDSSMKVRAEAVGLLASLHDVSFNLLEQTLDKKLMSHGKKGKSFSDRQIERFRGAGAVPQDKDSGGQWSSGKIWGDNDPASLNESKEEEIRIMNTGSCGVFVKALEDEYMQVRTAGVDSLCELANQNSAFARMSIEFLVDMFNDEIESVRLNSINSLIKLHHYVDLREDQLDTVLESLNDFNQIIRDSVRQLLAHCTLSAQPCLYATVLALLGNLKKYPQDRESIWRCMKDLGTNHPNFVTSLVPELLVTHPYYAVPEPMIDDPAHVAVAILIFNASIHNQSIISLLPPYALKHYDYLHDSLPKLIPRLKHEKCELKTVGAEAIDEFFKSIIERIHDVSTCSNINKTFDSFTRDLSHVKHLHNDYAAAADFLMSYLICQGTLLKCRKDRTWFVPACLSTNACTSLHNDAKKIMKLSYQLEYTFSGQTYNNKTAIKSLRILSHCLSILLELRQTSRIQVTKKIDLKLWEPLLQRLQKFKEQCKALTTVDERVDQIINLEAAIEENLTEEIKLVEILQNFFLTYPIKLSIDNRIRQTFVQVIEPKSNLDNPIRFTSGLTHAVNIDVWLNNIEDIANVYIKVLYPDHKVQIHKPQNKEFTSFSSSRHHLITKLVLSHGTWTEPSHVKLSIVQGHPTDVREEVFSNKDSVTTDQNGVERSIRSSENYSDLYKGYIDISSVVRIYIQPRATGR